jgi:ATP-dependent Zn protease
MTKNDTWFDAFFRTVTSSPEFKEVVTTNRWNELKEGLKDMEKSIKDATKMNDVFKKNFETPEAFEAWESYVSQPYINRTMDEDNKASPLDIKYFENTNPETWGFKWVAWMKDLLLNLSENFIRPLKFKFLMQKLEQEAANPENPDITEDKKNEIFKQINEAYKKFNVSIPTGLLLYWPPGTGKTFITTKLAQELWAWLIKKSVWEFGSSYIHQTSQNIKKFFDQAKAESEKWPIILFLDEIDSLVSKRTDSVDGNKAEEVSQFLQEFNALWDAPNLIVIAATNRPDHLDSAILRSWRFDKKFYIWEPDFEARKELFQIYIKKANRPHKDLDYEKLATLTEWYVAADIEAICDEVSRDASRSILDLANIVTDWKTSLEEIQEQLDDHVINMELLEQAIKETTSSLKFVDMSVFDDWLKEEKENIRV